MFRLPIFGVLVALSSTPAQAQDVRITVLVDAFSERTDLMMDWGYSALIEHGETRILFDAGNDSDLFRHNVEQLGIDLRNLDFVVISHRHGDHTDGLKYLLSINPDVAIYVANDEYFGGPTPQQFFTRSVPALPARMRYFNGDVPENIPHGSPWNHANLHRVGAELELAPGIRVIRNLSTGSSFTETPELSLVLETPEGQLLFVGCAHPGIEAILDSAQAATRPVRLLAGGLHLVTMPDADVERLVQRLATVWNVQSVAPGHCTGELAFSLLSQLYRTRYLYAGVGEVVVLD